MTDPIRPSPRLPDDSAPLTHDKTPAYGIPDIALMKRKIEEAERRVEAKLAASGNGKPRIPSKWVPFLLVGSALGGAVVSTAALMPNDIPRWVLAVGCVLVATCGPLLAASAGLRKGVDK